MDLGPPRILDPNVYRSSSTTAGSSGSEVELPVQECRDLTCDADHREQVHAIRRRRRIEDAVPDRRTSSSGVPGSTPLGSTMIPAWSSPRPTSSSARIIPREASPRSSRSSSGTSRIGRVAPGSATLRRPGLEVPRAADDPTRVALPDVHLTDTRPVGIRMGRDVQRLPHEESTEVAVDVRTPTLRIRSSVERGDGQAPRDLLRRRVVRDVLTKLRKAGLASVVPPVTVWRCPNCCRRDH